MDFTRYLETLVDGMKISSIPITAAELKLLEAFHNAEVEQLRAKITELLQRPPG